MGWRERNIWEMHEGGVKKQKFAQTYILCRLRTGTLDGQQGRENPPMVVRHSSKRVACLLAYKSRERTEQ